MKELTPPDRERCQAETRESRFVLGGNCNRFERCRARPVAIVTENKPGPDGRCGSMSLCAECLVEFWKRVTFDCTEEPI